MGIARFALTTRPFAQPERSRYASIARGYLDALIIAGLVVLFLITFVIRTFYIPSVSMVPSLQVRDVVLVDEIAYRLRRPARGDIALFTPPVYSAGNEYVKRVIGVPGDRISISDGIVFRNGRALREPYENQPPNYSLAIRNYGIYVNGHPLDPRLANVPPRNLWQAADRVPNGFYFVLGDNRNYSDDSHVWGFAQIGGAFAAGPLSARRVAAGFAGRAFMILWPLGRLRVLES
jgi:signal peptidase I